MEQAQTRTGPEAIDDGYWPAHEWQVGRLTRLDIPLAASRGRGETASGHTGHPRSAPTKEASVKVKEHTL
jgi:hypothetical protein